MDSSQSNEGQTETSIDESKTETSHEQTEKVVEIVPETSSAISVELNESTSTAGSYGPVMLSEDIEKLVSQLTDGFLSEVHPQLLEMREKTKEITKNQGILIETIEQENRKYSENKEIEEFTKLIPIVESYYAKLKKIKNDMDHLDERLGKLKKRSLKLKERRVKKDRDEAERRERELVLERELTAKPAS